MKKLLILVMSFLLTGCFDSNVINKADIKGYYEQVYRDFSGDIDDMTKDPYAYLEITDDRLFFYTESTEDKGYYEGIASKYYILEDDQLYYDYYELKGNDWKENMNEAYGGIFKITYEGDYFILTEYLGDSIEDGYKKDTYKKINNEDRLLEY